MISKFFKNIKGDVTGGTMAGLLALPETIAYGILVFAPLGKDGIKFGVLSGLIAVIFINIIPSVFFGSRILSSGPFSLSSIMLASVTAYAMKQSLPDGITPIAVVLFTVFLAGIFQFLFGLLKLGTLAKFIPQPVISGLLNGTAILIFIAQIRPTLGLDKGYNLLNLINETSVIEPLTVVISFSTCAAIIIGGKYIKKIPGPVFGIIAGCIVYYAILKLGYDHGRLGGVVGKIPSKIPTPNFAIDFFLMLKTPEFYKVIMDVVPMALGVAIIISMRTLIAVVSADNITQTRTNSNFELLGQGAGHIIGALFGGISSAGSVSRSLANYKYGGRGVFSKIITGIFPLLILLVLYPVVSKLPKVVLSGLLIILAYSSIDSWSIKQLAYTFKSKANNRRKSLVNILIVIAVTVTMVLIGTFEAVGIGIVISIVFFIMTMTRGIVRNSYNAKRVRSNYQRVESEINILEKHGSKIFIMELDGPLFFGTADNLADNIYKIFEDDKIDYIILDFKRVSDVDSTGLHILSQIKTKANVYSKNILLANIDRIMLSYAYSDYQNSLFPTFNDALAFAEDCLLEIFIKKEIVKDYTVGDFDVLSELSEKEIKLVENYFIKKEIKAGKTLFKQNDKSNEMYLLASGRVNIEITKLNKNERYRVSTICPGTIFGEMALVDRKPRSAFAIASEESNIVCYTLSNDDLTKISRKSPETGLRILAGLTSEISRRVRIANNMISSFRS